MVNNPFAHFLGWCTRMWLDFPVEINLPREISMVMSKTRKKPLMTFNVVSSEGFWYPRQENQSAFFIRHQVKPQVLFELLSERSTLTWQISFQDESNGEIFNTTWLTAIINAITEWSRKHTRAFFTLRLTINYIKLNVNSKSSKR